MGKLITKMVDKSFDNPKEYNKAKHELMLEYYNIFMAKWNVPEISQDAQEFLFDSFWYDGTVAAYNIPITKDLAFSKYAPFGNLNMYGKFNKFRLINEFGLSDKIVPQYVMKKNKNVVIGYATSNHLPVRQIVEYQVDRILDVRIAINNNLDLNKLALIFKSNNQNLARLKSTIKNVLSGKNAVVITEDDYAAMSTAAESFAVPFLVDKLHTYEKELKNELLTFLGINNMGMQEKKERAITDEVESNNELIKRYGNTFTKQLNLFKKYIKEVLGHDISFVDEVKEEMDGEDNE